MTGGWVPHVRELGRAPPTAVVVALVPGSLNTNVDAPHPSPGTCARKSSPGVPTDARALGGVTSSSRSVCASVGSRAMTAPLWRCRRCVRVVCMATVRTRAGAMWRFVSVTRDGQGSTATRSLDVQNTASATAAALVSITSASVTQGSLAMIVFRPPLCVAMLLVTAVGSVLSTWRTTRS